MKKTFVGIVGVVVRSETTTSRIHVRRVIVWASWLSLIVYSHVQIKALMCGELKACLMNTYKFIALTERQKLIDKYLV
jgi:hypothetical protein